MFSDADLAGDPDDRKSTSGLTIIVSGAPVIYASRKQTVVAQSTAEAEFLAANEATKELIWLTNLLRELNIEYEQPTLFVDNKSAIKIIKNNEIHRRSKHIEIKFHYIRSKYKEGAFNIAHVDSENQLADVLTKGLTGPRLESLTRKSGCSNIEGHNQKIIKGFAATARPRKIIMTRYRKDQQRNIPGLRLLPAVIIALLVVGSSALSSPLRLNREEPIFWVPTDHQVEIGIIEYDIDYSYVNPCQTIHKTSDWQSTYNVKQKAYLRLHEECNEMFHDTWLTNLEEMLKCKAPSSANEINKGRSKRFVVPFLVITCIILVTTAIIATAIHFFDPSSDHNRLAMVEAREREREGEIQDLKKAMSTYQTLNNQSATLFEQLTIKAEQNRLGIDNLALLLPEIAWESTKLYMKLHSSSADLREVTEACAKGELAPKAMGRLMALPELKRFNSKDTKLTSIVRKGPSTINFKFSALKKAENTRVYKANAFTIWTNLTGKPSLSEYAGPKYLIYNESSECTKGIDEPQQRGVFDECGERWTDPRLKIWVQKKVEEEDHKQLALPTIKKTETHSYVYCLYNNITSNGTSRRCPAHVFRLPLSQSFETAGIRHTATTEKLTIRDEILGIKSLHLNTSDPDEEMDNQLEMINSIRRLNAQISIALKEKAGWANLPITKETAIGLSILSFLSLFFTIFTYLCRCGIRGESGGEHITIVQPQSAPAQVPAPPQIISQPAPVPAYSVPARPAGSYYPEIQEKDHVYCQVHHTIVPPKDIPDQGGVLES